jgi:arylsulfatase A-like enzyme
MVTAMDAYVGKIVATLEEKGIADNTLIIFTSDNGPHDEGGADPNDLKASAPYKGMKRDLFDGGIHVPMIVHWPAAIKAARVDETPWAFADVLPTFAEIAGVPLTSVPRVKTNGLSIAGRLNDEPVEIPERILYWRNLPRRPSWEMESRALRDGSRCSALQHRRRSGGERRAFEKAPRDSRRIQIAFQRASGLAGRRNGAETIGTIWIGQSLG